MAPNCRRREDRKTGAKRYKGYSKASDEKCRYASEKSLPPKPNNRKRSRRAEDSHVDRSPKRPWNRSVESATRAALIEHDTFDQRATAQSRHIQYWVENDIWSPECFEPDIIEQLIAKESLSESSRKRSVSSFAEARQEKSPPYESADYEQELERKGSHIIPDGTLLDDVVFERICEELRSRNEAKILKNATPLIVPSA
ncbi:hypothetical protein BDY21DRAFT_363182 [Lineolata rhizophorae]|uniref:Uncharacterized protein n=1 Tax=Lineolata rhizophorae TaxID=578093 RepID=A0A6A6P2M2_9PEZI|nr:hypothetical protein BDY21DRAFT_363182 [Lineolata rhizophorae]